MRKELTPSNDKNQAHGLWVTYYNGTPLYEGNYVNGRASGLWVHYWLSGDRKGEIRIKEYILR